MVADRCWTEIRKKHSQEMASMTKIIMICILVRKGKEEESWFPLPRSQLMNLFSLPKHRQGELEYAGVQLGTVVLRSLSMARKMYYNIEREKCFFVML